MLLVKSSARMSLAMPPPIQSPFREEDSDSDASEDSAGLKQNKFKGELLLKSGWLKSWVGHLPTGHCLP